MEVEAAKMIGAGLAVIALAGVGVGIGNIFAALEPLSHATLRLVVKFSVSAFLVLP